MATETARSSTSSADSYIGSLISLTSKSEIRYEGILCNINTDESSIGLSNVRSFGTEGRKKDGPQFMPSDKVYEYILFRGSDIKDLQVKSSQPVQPSQPINSDPAIIQSHYPRPPTVSTTAGPTTHNLGQPGSTYPGGLPLYQPGGNMGSWAPSPPPPLPNTNTSVPSMYWPGYYPPPPPQLHQQQSLPRPPPPPPPSQAGLPMPPPSLQYPTFNPPLTTSEPPNANFPDYPSPFTTSTMPLPSLMQNSKLPNPSAPPLPPESQPPQLPTPSLVTPGQLLQSVAAVGGSAQTPPAVHKEVEVVQVVPTSSPPPPPPATVPAPVAAEAQPPILPLPPQSQMAAKPNGGNYQNRHSYNYRGRERGRGSGGSRPVMKFTEEFDFSAMNEKFNKDEVWGSLGKSSNKDKDGNATDEDDQVEEETLPNLPKVDVKPVYSKDDFFDSLSSNSLDRQSNYGRTRFSEQMKLDTETFGEFSRYRGGGRGGRGPYRGGRGRGGGYYGRGGGGGYYVGRGRGGRNPNQNQSGGGGDY